MEYRVEPLDLMQHINTKYREPFIREVISLDRDIDTKLLRDAVRQLAGMFSLLSCRYDKEKNIKPRISSWRYPPLTGKPRCRL